MLFAFFVLRAECEKFCITQRNETCPKNYTRVDRSGWEENVTGTTLDLFISNNDGFMAICELRRMDLKNLTISGNANNKSVLWLDIAHTNEKLQELKITNITVVMLNGTAPVSGKYRAENITLLNCTFVNAYGFEANFISIDLKTASSLRLQANKSIAIDWANTRSNSKYNLKIESPWKEGNSIWLRNLNDVNATLWRKGVWLQTRNNITLNMTFYGVVRVIQNVVKNKCFLSLNHTFGDIGDESKNDWTNGKFGFICNSTVPVNISLLQPVNYLFSMYVGSVHIDSSVENAQLRLSHVQSYNDKTVCQISSSKNITAVLDRMPRGDTVFGERIRVQFDNLEIDEPSNVNCSDLTFWWRETFIETRITSKFVESRLMVHNPIQQNHVHLTPVWDQTVTPSELANNVNKTIMSICAPSLNCSMYDIQADPDAGTETPFGFLDDAMSFGLKCESHGEYRCASMVLKTNPLDFFKKVCVYAQSPTECSPGDDWEVVESTRLEKELGKLSNSLSMLHIHFASKVNPKDLHIPENFPKVTDLRISYAKPSNLRLWLTNQLVQTVRAMTLNNVSLKLTKKLGAQTPKMNLTTLNLSGESALDDETSMGLVDVTDVYTDFNNYHKKYSKPPWPCQNVFLTDIAIDKINHTKRGWILRRKGTTELVGLNASSSKTICLAVSQHDTIKVTKQASTGPIWPLCLDFLHSQNQNAKLDFDNTWNGTDIAIQVFTDSSHKIEIQSNGIVPVNFSQTISRRNQNRKYAELLIGKTTATMTVTSPLLLDNDVLEHFIVNASESDRAMVFPSITVASGCNNILVSGDPKSSMFPKSLETGALIVMNSTEAMIGFATVKNEVVMHPGGKLRTTHTDYRSTNWTFHCLPELKLPVIEYSWEAEWDLGVTDSEDINEIPRAVVIVYPDLSRTKISDLNRTFIEESKPLVCMESLETCISIQKKTIFAQRPVMLHDARLDLTLDCVQDKKTCMVMKTEIIDLTPERMEPAVIAAMVVCCIIAVSGIVLLVLMLKWYRNKANMESTIKEALLEPPRNL